MRWIAAAVASSLLLGFVAGGTSADQYPVLPREDDRVAYVVTTQTRVFDYTVRLGGVSSCEDGFERQFDCQDVWLEGEAVDQWRVAFSREHAEVVSAGSWWVGGPRVEHFARPSGLWVGHPQALEGGASEERSNGLRVLFVGLAAGIRAAAGGEGSIAFAGFPAILSTTTTNPGETSVRLEAVSEETGFVYTSRYIAGEPWPDRVVLQEVGTDRVIAEANRTGFQPGTGPPLQLDGWEPLDFPPARHGVERLPWRNVPPGGEDLYLGLPEAWTLASAAPAGVIHRIEHPESYSIHATYVESNRDDFFGVPLQWATWSFKEAQPEAPVRWAGVSANALQLAEEARWFSYREHRVEDPWDWMPPREELPRLLVPVEVGVTVGASAIPADLRAFTLVWKVATRPELMDTPDAANYILMCGPAPNISLVWATVSAVNGQLLYRFAIAPAC